MIRALLLDEMLSPAIAGQLRQRGHDVSAIAERADLVGLSDDMVLTLAADEDRVVVTVNIGDLAALHAEWQAQGRSHAGLVYISTATFAQDRSFVGSIVGSLDASARSADLPGPNETRFLGHG